VRPPGASVMEAAQVEVLWQGQRLLCRATAMGWLCGHCQGSIVPPQPGAVCQICGAIVFDEAEETVSCPVCGMTFATFRASMTHRRAQHPVP
jgi:rubredoxin